MRSLKPQLAAFSILLGSAGVLAAPPVAGASRSTPPAHLPQPDPAQSRSFTGTIVRDKSQYLLRDESGKAWKVDDPDRVKSYEDKRVRINGRLDPDGKTIHIDSVELA